MMGICKYLLKIFLLHIFLNNIQCISPVGNYTRREFFILERAFSTNMEVETLKVRDIKRNIGGSPIFPLVGNSDPNKYGVYFTKVKLGFPPREFNVIVDTGSTDLWVKCTPCVGCPQSSQLGVEKNIFNPAMSHSSSPLMCSDGLCQGIGHCANKSSPCGLLEKYMEGSKISGYYLRDIIQLDTTSEPSSSSLIVFGCGTNIQGPLALEDGAMVDGILGLGPNYPSIISQLSSRQIIPGIFGHCLIGDEGGVLVLGQTMDLDINYSPMVPNMASYNLYLESITVDRHLLPINLDAYSTSHRRGVIVDSGTTLAYLVSDVYDALMSAVTAAASNYSKPMTFNENRCYRVSSSGIKMFPQIAFNFDGGASMILKPEDYLLKSRIKGIVCMGFQRSPDSFYGAMILGELVLKDKWVVYDLIHHQLGWVDYNCSKMLNASKPFKGGHSGVAAAPTAINPFICCVVVVVYGIFNYMADYY